MKKLIVLLGLVLMSITSYAQFGHISDAVKDETVISIEDDKYITIDKHGSETVYFCNRYNIITTYVTTITDITLAHKVNVAIVLDKEYQKIDEILYFHTNRDEAILKYWNKDGTLSLYTGTKTLITTFYVNSLKNANNNKQSANNVY